MPAVEPAGRRLRCMAVTGRVAPRQGTGAAPAGGRSETGTPGTDCARRCSKAGEEGHGPFQINLHFIM